MKPWNLIEAIDTGVAYYSADLDFSKTDDRSYADSHYLGDFVLYSVPDNQLDALRELAIAVTN